MLGRRPKCKGSSGGNCKIHFAGKHFYIKDNIDQNHKINFTKNRNEFLTNNAF